MTPKELPEWTRISIIEASPHAQGHRLPGRPTAYQLDDYTPYLYKTTDYGASLDPDRQRHPATEFTRVIREDPVRRGPALRGDRARGLGVVRRRRPLAAACSGTCRRCRSTISRSRTATWSPRPTAGASGSWTTSPRSGSSPPAVTASDEHLFQPVDAYRTFGRADVHYWLKRGEQKVTLEFLDGQGKVIHAFTSDPDPQRIADSTAMAKAESASHDSLIALGVQPASLKSDEPQGGRSRFEGGWRPTRPESAPNKQGMNTFHLEHAVS